jgi:hypothetical protein
MKTRSVNPWPDRLFKLTLLALALLWFHVPPSSIQSTAKIDKPPQQVVR